MRGGSPDGLGQGYSLLLTKSSLDFIASIVLGASLGIGVPCAALTAQGEDTQQALGVDPALLLLDPDGGLELIGLLDEEGWWSPASLNKDTTKTQNVPSWQKDGAFFHEGVYHMVPRKRLPALLARRR